MKTFLRSSSISVDYTEVYGLLEELGYKHDEFCDIMKSEGEVYASAELHIEQNGVLEKLIFPLEL